MKTTYTLSYYVFFFHHKTFFATFFFSSKKVNALTYKQKLRQTSKSLLFSRYYDFFFTITTFSARRKITIALIEKIIQSFRHSIFFVSTFFFSQEKINVFQLKKSVIVFAIQ